MAKAYIANKPVRFDRNYSIGEIIPAEVIDPRMRRKLTEMGRILCVDIPDGGTEGKQEAPQDGAGTPTEGADGTGDTDTHPDPENAPQGESDGTADGSDDTPQDGGTDPDATDTNVGSTGDAGEDTNVPTAPEFVCEVCGKAFSSKNALSAHSRAHKE